MNYEEPHAGRMTGRTTRLAIYYLERCIERAGERTYIVDHWEHAAAHRSLGNTVCKMLDILNVEYHLDETSRGVAITVHPLVKAGS